MSSTIYMITTTNESVLTNGIIPLTTIARRITPCIETGNDTILLPKPGYIKVTGTITFTAPSTGNATIVLKKNNEEVPGITATESVATANTEYHTVSVSGLIRVTNFEGPVSLSLVNTGVEITTHNVSLIAEYI